MGEADLDLVAEMYRAFHAGDADLALSYFAEDVAVDATARVDGGIGRGRDALAAIIGQWLSMFDEWHEDIEQMKGAEGRVCVIARQRGRGRDSGVEAETRYGVLYEIRGDVIARMTLYREPAEALEAAGLRDRG